MLVLLVVVLCGVVVLVLLVVVAGAGVGVNVGVGAGVVVVVLVLDLLLLFFVLSLCSLVCCGFLFCPCAQSFVVVFLVVVVGAGLPRAKAADITHMPPHRRHQPGRNKPPNKQTNFDKR